MMTNPNYGQTYGNFYLGDYTQLYSNVKRTVLKGDYSQLQMVVYNVEQYLIQGIYNDKLDSRVLSENDIRQISKNIGDLITIIKKNEDIDNEQEDIMPCYLNFHDIYENLKHFRYYENVKSKRQSGDIISTPRSEFASRFSETLKLPNSPDKDRKLAAMIMEIYNMDEMSIRTSIVYLNGPNALMQPRLDIVDRRSQFVQYLTQKYNIGSYLRNGKAVRTTSTMFPDFESTTSAEPSISSLSPALTFFGQQLNNNDNSGMTTINPMLAFFGQQSSDDNFDGTSTTTIRTTELTTKSAISNFDSFNLNSGTTESMKRRFEYDEEDVNYNKRLKTTNREDNYSGKSLYDEIAETDDLYGKTVQIREFLEILQNSINIFKQQLLMLTSNALSSICEIDIKHIHMNRGKIYAFLRKQNAVSVEPIPFCSSKRCYILKSKKDFFLMDNQNYCFDKVVLFNVEFCRVTSEMRPPCWYSLNSSSCMFSPIEPESKILLNGGSAVLAPYQNLIIQNTQMHNITFDNVTLKAVSENLFLTKIGKLEFYLTREQIDINFKSTTFKDWVYEKFEFLDTIDYVQIALIFVSLGMSCFSAIHIYYFCKFKCNKDRDIESIEQNKGESIPMI